MAVYGTSYAKFKEGATVKDLDYCLIKPSWRLPKMIVHKSICNGVTHYLPISEDKARFEVVCNIWKNADPQGTLAGLLAYDHATVKFMPHEDYGEYIKDAAGATEADFIISKMQPLYLDAQSQNYADRLLVVFDSLKGIYMPGAIGRYLVDTGGDFLVDGAGNKLLFPNIGG